jgi:hypothetical protein
MSSESCFVGTRRCEETTQRVINFKPIADSLCTSFSFDLDVFSEKSVNLFLKNCKPDDTLTLQICDPESRFGYVSRQENDNVNFKTTCQYSPGVRTVRVDDQSRVQQPGLDMNALAEQSIRQRIVGIVAAGTPIRDGPGVKGERVTLGSLRPGHHSIVVFMDADPAATCPVLGKTHDIGGAIGHTVFSGSCGAIGNSATCSYKRTSIAGGCRTKQCVNEGLATFTQAVSELIAGSELTAIEAGFRDRGLARLVDGLKQEGACGTEGVSCLSLLAGDCKKLSEAATEMQTQGRGILYRAFKQASEKCVADAGLRARTEDRV